MKIAVCIKRVPDTESRFSDRRRRHARSTRPGSSTTSTISTATRSRSALQLNEKAGAGEDVVVSPRPRRGAGDAPQGDEHGRRSRRASQGRARSPMDGLAIAHALAAELRRTAATISMLFGKHVDRLVRRRRRADDRGAARPSVRHGDVEARHREREGHGAPRARGRGRDGGVPAAGGGDDRRGDRAARAIRRSRGSWRRRRSRSRRSRRSWARSTSRRRRWSCRPSGPAGRIVGEGAAAVPELVRLLQTEAKVL